MAEGDPPPVNPEPGTSNCPPGYRWQSPTNTCIQICPQGQTWDAAQNTCISRSGSVSGNPTAPCPPGETREPSSAICRCPGGQWRDVVSHECRSPAGND